MPGGTASRAIIVADDLTGCLDTAAQWAQLGIRVAASLDDTEVGGSEVCALNTNTRESTEEAAFCGVRKVLAKHADRIIYKKIDSTFRGNVCTEIRAVLNSGAWDKLVVAPAYPGQGRTVVDGRLLLPSAGLRDPSIDLADRLRAAFHKETHSLRVHDVRRGPQSIAGMLDSSESRVFLCDAETDSDLLALAQASRLTRCRVLAVGSAGLAGPIAALWSQNHRPLVRPSKADGRTHSLPTLILAGTHQKETMRQLEVLREADGARVISVDARRLLSFDGYAREKRRVLEEASSHLANGRSVALSTGLVGYVPGCLLIPARWLGETGAVLFARHQVSSAIISGGDTCYEVLSQIGVIGLDVIGEESPGIPLSVLRGGPLAGLPLISKAGGFGDPEALLRLVRTRTAD